MKYFLSHNLMLVTIVMFLRYPLMAYSQVCYQQTTLYATFEYKRLNSPLYPRTYENNLNCAVNISGVSGQPIWIKSLLVAMENCSSCGCDYLSIYGGTKYCGLSPIDVVTNSSFAHIIFHTDSSLTYTGFILQYAAIPSFCTQQQILYASSEPRRLSSPNYPSQYNNSLNCSVNIYSESGGPIRIQSFFMELESEATCSYDYLSINGVKYCGRSPIDVVLRVSPVQIIFHTDGSQTYSGFVLQYEVISTVCTQQQILYASSEPRRLSSPNYPRQYNNSLNCSVNIYSGSGETIRIQSFFMELEDEATCSYDYLSINGVKYCGRNHIDVVLKVSPVQIIFVTDVRRTYSGFVLQYEVIPTVCFQQQSLFASAEAKLLYSPLYPNTYQNNLNCSVTIYSSSGHSIRITSVWMDLEDSSCSYDYLLINNVKYCGTTPFDVVLTASPVQITFRTDSSGTFSGFVLQYVEILTDYLVPICGTTSVTATTDARLLYSPNFPSAYTNSLNCTLNILGGSGQPIWVKSLTMETETPCVYDYLSVNGVKYCGTSPIDVVLNAPVPIIFRTDSSFGFSGFLLQYVTIAPAFSCKIESIIADSSKKHFLSSDISSSPAGSQCFEWHIITKNGFGAVSLVLSSLRLGASYPCTTSSSSYVAVYDGLYKTSPLMAVMCGNTPTTTYNSSYSSMTVVYRTSSPGNDYFNLTFSSVGDMPTATIPCNNLYLTAESSNNYFRSTDFLSKIGFQCLIWNINTKYGIGKVSLTVLTFSVGTTLPCNNASSSNVTIYDGPSTTSPLKAALCGYQSSSSYNSSSSSLTVVYYTANPSSNTFTFLYTSVGDFTTAITTSTSTSITTTTTTSSTTTTSTTTVNPTTRLTNTTHKTTTEAASICEVNNLYAEKSVKSLRSSDIARLPTRNQCYEWHIYSSFDFEKISIDVSTFNMGSSSTCTISSSSSYIAIYDGANTTSQPTAILCGSQSGYYLQSSSSSLTLVYRTSDRSGESFTFTYSSVRNIYNSSATTDTELSDGFLIGIIAGSIACFLVIVGALVFAVVWRRRKQKQCPPSGASVSTPPSTTTTGNVYTNSSFATDSKESWLPTWHTQAENICSPPKSSTNKGLSVNPYTRAPSHRPGEASSLTSSFSICPPTTNTSGTTRQMKSQPLSGRAAGAMRETGSVENPQDDNLDYSTDNIYEKIDDTYVNSANDIYVNATSAIYKKPTNANYFNVAALQDIKAHERPL